MSLRVLVLLRVMHSNPYGPIEDTHWEQVVVFWLSDQACRPARLACGSGQKCVAVGVSCVWFRGVHAEYRCSKALACVENCFKAQGVWAFGERIEHMGVTFLGENFRSPGT